MTSQIQQANIPQIAGNVTSLATNQAAPSRVAALPIAPGKSTTPRMDGQSPAAVAAAPNLDGSNKVNGAAPIPAAGHSRKGSIMVGGGVDIAKGERVWTETSLGSPTDSLNTGNIAFGTANVDSPNPLLSSSPAAPSLTGAHLAGTVKSFGSIDADGSTNSSAVNAARRASGLTPPVNGGETVTSPPTQHKQPNLHSLFAGKAPNPNAAASVPGKSPSPLPLQPSTQNQSPNMQAPMHGRRPSVNGGYMHNGIPIPGNPMYTSPNSVPNQAHLRPPMVGSSSQPRSPNANPMNLGQFNGQMMPQGQQGFRPANGFQQPQIRPNAYQGMQPGMYRPGITMPQHGMTGYGQQHMGPQGSYPMMQYASQGYYVS